MEQAIQGIIKTATSARLAEITEDGCGGIGCATCKRSVECIGVVFDAAGNGYNIAGMETEINEWEDPDDDEQLAYAREYYLSEGYEVAI
jgi:hypothetical protein